MAKYLVWRGPPSDTRFYWETSWIRYLISTLQLKEIVTSEYKIPVDATHVVLVLSNYTTWPEKFPKVEYGIIHLSEEFYQVKSYPSDAKFIWRNYYDPDINDPRVKYFPLGYKQGLEYFPIREPSRKEKDWCFFGALKNDRPEMINEFSIWSDNWDISLIAGWNHSSSLNTEDYGLRTSKSRYVPSCMGNYADECFRTWEALEIGSVPVTIRKPKNSHYTGESYYDDLAKICGLDPIPWPQLESWNQWHVVVKSIDYTDLHNKCMDWWDKSKLHIRRTLTIEGCKFLGKTKVCNAIKKARANSFNGMSDE